ncbi:NAD(P)/FAD-dependent oxidoreductase [Enterococcus raffinosus]|uniref:NAD(P)/FAD-dependent oxidoreductase n=1 Tax=Enterococcus raffinosus TaxID=71452 RepID=UPI00209DFB74|nr:NAD(P)/FAD-dependent oxidoreductase [Enterococcus raffinosus]
MTQLSCTVNPQACMEGALEINELPEKKNVVIIGAGPGGLEAARTAALRGCDVTIYEAADKIGGTFGAIANKSFKKRITDLITWYGVQLAKLNVAIKLNTRITADDPVLVVADEIIVATGALPLTPPISGLDDPRVIDVTQAHIQGVSGDNILVCGGGLSGCDTALELAMEGKKVTIVEMLDTCARDVMSINKISLERMLAEYNVEIMTETKVTEISHQGVVVETADGQTQVLAADTIITAFGQKSNSKVAEAIWEKYSIKTTLIGDCQKVDKAGNAIREGFYAALAFQ